MKLLVPAPSKEEGKKRKRIKRFQKVPRCFLRKYAASKEEKRIEQGGRSEGEIRRRKVARDKLSLLKCSKILLLGMLV